MEVGHGGHAYSTIPTTTSTIIITTTLYSSALSITATTTRSTTTINTTSTITVPILRLFCKTQNPQLPPPFLSQPILNSEPSELKEAYYDYPTSQTLLEYGEVDDGWLEEEEDDDPVFVLTDEWKEFFAKSEAKRKLEKQQAKKKKGKAKQSRE